MERRNFLAAAGGSLGALVAGCLSGSDGTPADEPGTGDTDTPPDSGPSSTPTDRPTKNTPTPTDGQPDGTDEWTPAGPWDPTSDPETTEVTVEDVVVRKATTYESVMGSGGVLAAAGTQYVVAAVRGGDDFAADAFAFDAGGESWDPGLTGTVGATNYAVAGHEGGSVGAPLSPNGPQFLAFELPSPMAASDPEIRFSGGADATGGMSGATWSLPDAAAEALAAEGPSFELDSLSVPGSVSQGDPLSVSLTVRNVSGVDGRLLAALYWPTERIADDDESHVLNRRLAAGESATLSRELDTEYTATESGPVTLAVRGHVSAERTVDVQNVPER